MTVLGASVKHFSEVPLISVCIVTYNQQNYIRDAVMSVLAQVNPTDFDLEILVGDDCSTDSTPQILEDLATRYSDCITIVTQSQNVGGCENYLALLGRARGDFIAHLDGDDFWLPGKLSAQLAFLNLHQECAAVYTAAVAVDAKGVLVGGFSNPQPDVIDTDYLLARGNFLNHSSVFYRAQSLERLGALDVPFVDYMVHLILAQQGRLGLLPAAYVVYRRMTSTSILKNQFSHFDELYLQTLILMAEKAPKAVRYSCCATYMVNTLAGHPSWCKENDFWLRSMSLVHRFKLNPMKLMTHMVPVLFSGVRKVLSARVSRFLYRGNTLVIFHPRH